MWSILKSLRENPKILIDSQKKRDGDLEIVERAIELDKKWREMRYQLDKLRHERNKISREMKNLKGREREKAMKKAKEIASMVKSKEKELKELENELNEVLLSIPNILHDSVPIGRDDSENVAIKYWGKPKVPKVFEEEFRRQHGCEYEVIEKPPVPHADAVEVFGLADIERAGKVSGSRFYYLLDDLIWLDFALITYALDYLSKKGFKIVSPPYMMKRRAYEGVTTFDDFEEVIYKVEDEDLYLIATSEHPIAAMHMDEVLEEKELPLLYAGVSPCFRKEAGAHGKDTKGIFRVHQFNKVEQFIFCLPEQSWDWHEKLLENVEDLWQGLEIPYRIVNICTGDIGIVAAKKYDLEVWMPSQGKYREMVSCSNCTDWQSYRLNIRFAEERGKPTKGFVHTLNSTAIATTRAITAIIENFQEEDGRIRIPKVLRKYLENIDSAPKDYIVPKMKKAE
ncbi:seryl-tRNA synthetase [Archaeoglobus sulfaticallidus PM70-1]|uniref:Serine--tRNA ligase n=1 Tax=Archaeoglobus sulfaticallidus PM70-1 TaxID=387631 RepID=N0BN50_9EURY|nr:serine--tRNA ligase [Archaeoglobus sulfaticallidus]AGK61730.1 seryl-tRNA synthetase [Archaeoglobus sulfaticallidus PM70-1]